MHSPPLLLLIEDYKPLADVISRRLSERFTVDVAGSLSEAEQAGAARGWIYVAILLDLGLPDASGLDALERMLAIQEAPIIIVTGSEDENIHIQAIRAGAHDIVLKHGDVHEIFRRILCAIERHACLEDTKNLEMILCHFQFTHQVMEASRRACG